ncbi:MAG: hypothetical protein IPG25_08190 [Proteobacteria bacterium]|nr:hypothetical protein [Pseudomonadota bacterium]
MSLASAESSQLAEAIAVVQAFMHELAARNLDAATAVLTTDFKMTATGGHVFTRLADFAAFSRQRNRGVKKTDLGMDACFLSEAEHGPQVVVYIFGTMAGEWVDGIAFANVRYLDRFVVRGARIAAMDIYSDMAEHRGA